ncbi:4-hydroxy-tetrahydrodipicolinate synthase [Candidatus Neoehrlichia procyonis]|uniref:4-hydroxy-tetrahydrodipicolinate synthase n=1 Tax=Candidatus Neoehrlichia procyonis str. RAC413 TaxID=1359163 RepID=A0A0F3NLU6_9RICK|nr:4-hydroxy-tetrahydrodipicolinate synthase [Candidatus Neoehrlichia lotoris]KJV68662.1 dihydrodipicolinate synthase [Candidatus Neoehrlichia lotoris str. RAC413]
MKLHGVFTALVTPFKEDLSFDEEKFSSLIEWQINEGVHGLVPCGTTGEYPTLSFKEYCNVITLCIAVTNKRVPVIVGTSSNCTRQAIKRTLFAQSVKADAALVVIPYYNKPTEEGVYQHFKAIHDATNIPIVIYNIPKRSAIDVSDFTLSKIINLSRVIAIKDATGDMNKPLSLKSLINKKEFYFLSGDDSTALTFNVHGGSGCISVISNVVPKLCSKMQNAFLSGNFHTASQINNQLFSLSQVLFCESNPVPTKYALSLMNKVLPQVRLPLVMLQDVNKLKVSNTLKDLKVIT